MVKDDKSRMTTSTETIELSMPEGLLNRVRAFCEKKGVDFSDFVMDAIAEKLAMVHKERRRKSRL